MNLTRASSSGLSHLSSISVAGVTSGSLNSRLKKEASGRSLKMGLEMSGRFSNTNSSLKKCFIKISVLKHSPEKETSEIWGRLKSFLNYFVFICFACQYLSCAHFLYSMYIVHCTLYSYGLKSMSVPQSII